MKVVVVDKIHKQYHDHVIFDDFSMEIEQGSFVAIQGVVLCQDLRQLKYLLF